VSTATKIEWTWGMTGRRGDVESCHRLHQGLCGLRPLLCGHAGQAPEGDGQPPLSARRAGRAGFGVTLHPDKLTADPVEEEPFTREALQPPMVLHDPALGVGHLDVPAAAALELVVVHPPEDRVSDSDCGPPLAPCLTRTVA